MGLSGHMGSCFEVFLLIELSAVGLGLGYQMGLSKHSMEWSDGPWLNEREH
jgi:hypothetical protein